MKHEAKGSDTIDFDEELIGDGTQHAGKVGFLS